MNGIYFIICKTIAHISFWVTAHFTWAHEASARQFVRRRRQRRRRRRRLRLSCRGSILYNFESLVGCLRSVCWLWLSSVSRSFASRIRCRQHTRTHRQRQLNRFQKSICRVELSRDSIGPGKRTRSVFQLSVGTEPGNNLSLLRSGTDNSYKILTSRPLANYVEHMESV